MSLAAVARDEDGSGELDKNEIGLLAKQLGKNLAVDVGVGITAIDATSSP